VISFHTNQINLVIVIMCFTRNICTYRWPVNKPSRGRQLSAAKWSRPHPRLIWTGSVSWLMDWYRQVNWLIICGEKLAGCPQVVRLIGVGEMESSLLVGCLCCWNADGGMIVGFWGRSLWMKTEGDPLTL